MTEQLYWEDVELGAEIPSLTKCPSRLQLVRHACASGDLSRIHYDDSYAESQGFSRVIVHGTLQYSFLAQMLTDWIGDQGWIRRIACTYRRAALVEDSLICKGTVQSKKCQQGEHHLACEIWIENEQGEITTRGSATIVLPSRAGLAIKKDVL